MTLGPEYAYHQRTALLIEEIVEPRGTFGTNSQVVEEINPRLRTPPN
ncbi:unannotated protein [freshwater metagenome]|uniref:Unannotated protein n=1 Tax=freshwater metagenome TaxID=449393 RepID=A0A6J6EJF5_9ZZZZ